MVIFDAKLAELQRHLTYLRTAFAGCRANAHPDAAERLEYLGDAVLALIQEAATLEHDLRLYKAANKPATDIWRQLLTRLRELSAQVQHLRILQLPAHLATTPHDHYMSNVLKQMHREVGLTDIHPVASLHQGLWFAMVGNIPRYPLYFAPVSLISDPGELGLMYHEIGHALFRLWGNGFAQVLQSGIERAIRRKAHEVQSISDPASRVDHATALVAWQSKVNHELEETACDAVGTLLGGPVFVMAARIGLLLMGDSPFSGGSLRYPALDCRMRLGSVGMRRLGLDDPMLDTLDSGWARVQFLSQTNKSRWYDWLYDDQYLDDIVGAVEGFLTAKGLNLYGPSCGGLRQGLSEGAGLMLTGGAAYSDWSNSFLQKLMQTYAP